MIDDPAFLTEPWRIRETSLELERLAQSESVFALSNGHIGWRGNLEEGEPHGIPGSYLNGVYEHRPLPYAESGYGYPESGQTIINVTNGKLIRLLVDDEPFDVRYGRLESHERTLDLRAGVMHRDARWTSPAGCAVHVQTTRLVSFEERAIAAIRYTVTAEDKPLQIALQSELVANEELPTPPADPRVAAVLTDPLRHEADWAHDARATLIHVTEHSGIRVAAAMDHDVETTGEAHCFTESFNDIGRTTVTAVLQPGESLTLVKYVAYGWSSMRSLPAMRDQVAAALTVAKQTGWYGMLAEQRAYLDDFWSRADVEVEGDPLIQQAVRFALFEVLQSGARAEGRAIPSKGLTGPGYDGHAFWDSETFVLAPLTYTMPHAAADALRWRHDTLEAARERARQLGLEGAAFPWRSINGDECSGYWPAGTAAFHVNADIADAVARYVRASDDRDFERTVGLELLVPTARLWNSLGHFANDGTFRIDGVTGPDEYSAIVDNNIFTNLMAQRNLRVAADVAERFEDEAVALGVTGDECAQWRKVADAICLPYDEELGVHAQAEGFTDHEVWDFESTPPEHYPLLLNYPYFDLYRKQVVKQADLVLAMHLRGRAFTAEQKLRNFEYYEPLTVRDSSLSACTQSVIAAEVGWLDLAYDYLSEAAMMDLEDLEQNTRDGLHMASLAGVWISLVAGVAGMRALDGSLDFRPRLFRTFTRLAFGLMLRGSVLKVEVLPDTATYRVEPGGSDLPLYHYGERIIVKPGEDLTLDLPEFVPPQGPAPTQPPGRKPPTWRPNPPGPMPGPPGFPDGQEFHHHGV